MNGLLFALAALAIAGIQVMSGGWHPAFALPGYGLLALAALLSWWRSRRTPISSGATDGLAAGGLFFGYIVVRAYLSPEAYLARNDLYLAIAAFTLYLLVALNLTTAKWRGIFVGSLLLLGFTNSLIGAIQFTRANEYAIFHFLPRGNYGSRASGFYGYPNHLALFLEVCVLMGFSVAFWSRWRPWKKLLAGYCSAACLVGLLMTGSRGGYAGLAAGFLVFGFLSIRVVGEFVRNRAVALLVAAILVFASLGYGVQHMLSRSGTLQERVGLGMAVNKDSRLDIWKAAWRQFRQQPSVGMGSGTYLYYGRQYASPTFGGDPIHAHNEYLELLAEYGIFGLAAALMFLDSHIRGKWKWISRRLARNPDSLAMGDTSLAMTIGALSAATACVVHSGTDFTLHMPANMLTMAFIFGLLANPESARETTGDVVENPDANLSGYVRLALPALGIWMAATALPTWPAEYYSFRCRLVAKENFMESAEIAQSLEDLSRRGLKWDPKHPELYRYAGVAETAMAIQSGDPEVQKKWSQQAISSYESSLRLAPGDAYVVLNLAWAYEAQKRYPESEPLFQRAVTLDPTASNAHYAYAAHLQGQGKFAEAAAEFQKSFNLGGGQSARMGLESVTEELKTRAKDGRPLQ